MKDLTAKEITINYLRNIKKFHENAFLELAKADIEDSTRLLSVNLASEISTLNRVIEIVKSSEGE